jgi:hypothetical protein
LGPGIPATAGGVSNPGPGRGPFLMMRGNKGVVTANENEVLLDNIVRMVDAYFSRLGDRTRQWQAYENAEFRLVVDGGRLCWNDVNPAELEDYQRKHRPIVERWRAMKPALDVSQLDGAAQAAALAEARKLGLIVDIVCPDDIEETMFGPAWPMNRRDQKGFRLK